MYCWQLLSFPHSGGATVTSQAASARFQMRALSDPLTLDHATFTDFRMRLSSGDTVQPHESRSVLARLLAFTHCAVSLTERARCVDADWRQRYEAARNDISRLQKACEQSAATVIETSSACAEKLSLYEAREQVQLPAKR